MKLLIAGCAGFLIGEAVRRRLNRLAYRLHPTTPADIASDRLADTDETGFDHPGPRLWVPILLGTAWASTAWASTGVASDQCWIFLVGWLAFSGIGAWLAAVDLDVLRLPDSAQALLATATLLAGIGLSWGDLGRILTGAGNGIGCGLAFLLVHVMSQGGLGLGDVKLVATCGWWLGIASPSSPASPIVGLAIAGALAVVYSLLTRSRQFAFGPWLVSGTFLSGLVLPLVASKLSG